MISLFELLIIAQIIIEAIPVSSSGHCMLIGLYAQKYLNLSVDLNNDALSILYLPTLIMLAVVFWNEWTSMVRRLIKITGQWLSTGTVTSHSSQWASSVGKLIMYAIISDIVTLVGEFTIKRQLATFVWFSAPWSTLIGFCITSTLLISLRYLPSASASSVSLSKSIFIGCAQMLAFFPGVSRFGSTYVAGQWMGLTPRQSIQYSFIMHTGLMIGLIARTLLTTKIPLFELWAPFLSTRMLCIMGISTLASIWVFKQICTMAAQGNLWRLGAYMLAPIIVMTKLLFF